MLSDIFFCVFSPGTAIGLLQILLHQSAARISFGLKLNIPKKEITQCKGPKKGSCVSFIMLFEVTSAFESCEEATAILFYSVTDICSDGDT